MSEMNSKFFLQQYVVYCPVAIMKKFVRLLLNLAKRYVTIGQYFPV